MGWLSIGEFSAKSHLSAKALRLYDRLDLLTPQRVDPHTGYRWYVVEQLERARRVSMLRRLDMPLAQIREVLDLPDAEAADAVGDFWCRREADVASQRALAQLLLDTLKDTESDMYEVSTRPVPTRALVKIGRHLAADDIAPFIREMISILTPDKVAPLGGQAGRPFLRFHAEVSRDSDGPVEFCLPLSDVHGADRVRDQLPEARVNEEAGGTEAYLTVPKSDLHSTVGFETLHNWVQKNRPDVTWVPQQIFLLDPESAGPDDAVVEISAMVD
ncbi:MerR family transcriptional regulator [Antrihabitans cavernicola]|uniref:MerR family transcriptional regulator n=1 Tax=Antrihabitans cavernicola TaxID=2495913 RepID=A0A5A7SII6_9NOCA|nr:MerR family transcriptional regulator [Spelaeibacter cavernicola]KAA0024061.1 MerR family transcriptional regulator [Spelaeibacter cavernicola]